MNNGTSEKVSEKIWLKNYPKGIKPEIDISQYKNILEVLTQACDKFPDRPVFTNMGKTISYRDLDRRSTNFAAFLQNELGLKKGDRIAIQMPNVLQFPICMFGALKAGLVVVNTNPLYTEREMKHQFNDAGVKAIVILANFAHHLETILDETKIEHIVLTEVGDALDFPKNIIVNKVLKYIKKLVPNFSLPTATTYLDAIKKGQNHPLRPVEMNLEEVAFLQYTGGTTGISKGAMLTHRNIVSNMEQINMWMRSGLTEGVEIALMPLPMYHIFCLTVNCLALVKYGVHNIMITNPKDQASLLKDFKKYPITLTTGVNTLFNALNHNPEFQKMDFKNLKFSVAGGMALQTSVAASWKEITGTNIYEGYGLTETSPVAAVNPIDGTGKVGTIGLPVPSTEICIMNDDEKILEIGESGEICIRGPQVMKGYWNQAAETEKVFTKTGWLKTGDIGIMDQDGYTKIVDRKKDMILVSGFNVYPNEIEEVIASCPGVLEVAAVGVADERSGEVVKIFVVIKDASATKESVLNFAKANLTAYKVPKYIEFRKELPKTNVGKILRRELRNQPIESNDPSNSGHK
jgi:long-chain acyl-CoA synthetase